MGVGWAQAPRPRGDVTELVGRESELATLADFVDRVADGQQALLLAGEAGIGKTVLWSEALVLAEVRADVRVLIARPAQSEAEFSFSTLGDPLEPAMNEVLPELPDPQRRSLEVPLLLREGSGPTSIIARSRWP
jgi:AAA ATPase domain